MKPQRLTAFESCMILADDCIAQTEAMRRDLAAISDALDTWPRMPLWPLLLVPVGFCLGLMVWSLGL